MPVSVQKHIDLAVVLETVLHPVPPGSVGVGTGAGENGGHRALVPPPNVVVNIGGMPVPGGNGQRVIHQTSPMAVGAHVLTHERVAEQPHSPPATAAAQKPKAA